MKLAQWQSLVAKDPHRFKVVVAGRRSGKTYLSIRQICYHARLPNQNIFYITSSYRQAKMIAWKLLKEKLLDLRWVNKINESELTITLKNNSSISLKGSENIDALRGVSLSYCVIDEAADVDEELFPTIIRPALADQEGGCLFITTPKGKSNWVYEAYRMEEDAPDYWKSFTTTTAEAGFVSETEIEAAKMDMSERQFRQEFLATFETYENRVAWEFFREKNVKDLEPLDTSILHVGLDFNVTPICAAICVRVGDDLYQFDEIRMDNSNTAEMAEELKNRYPRSKIFVYPDPSGNARKTSANGQTDFSILQNSGFVTKAPRRHDAVRDRINAINARFRSADGRNHLFISNKCKYTIECLEKYSFKENTQTPDKGGKVDYSHMFDALSYCVAFLFPLTREVEPMEPQRWGHNIKKQYAY